MFPPMPAPLPKPSEGNERPEPSSSVWATTPPAEVLEGSHFDEGEYRSRRHRILALTMYDLQLLLVGKASIVGIPADAKLVAVNQDFQRQTVEFLLEHLGFNQVEFGALAPRYQLVPMQDQDDEGKVTLGVYA